MRYFLRLSYNGAGFHGWQSQPNATSVQQTLETALSAIMRVATPITGAGRTDTGVNARCMFAHFDTELPISDKNRFLKSVNGLVGKDIVVYDIIEAKPEAHARFDAVEREYRYFVTHARDPFLRQISWFSPSALDYEMMNRAAEMLLHTEDFTSFAKLHSDAKTNICKVTEAQWIEEDAYGQDLSVFIIKADRFLRNMVRAVVGTLVDVGRGKLSLSDFEKIIQKKNRSEAGTSMPPQALFLWNVTYPENIFYHDITRSSEKDQ